VLGAQHDSVTTVMLDLSQTLYRLHGQGQRELDARSTALYTFPLKDVTYKLKEPEPEPQNAAVATAKQTKTRSGRHARPPEKYTNDSRTHRRRTRALQRTVERPTESGAALAPVANRVAPLALSRASAIRPATSAEDSPWSGRSDLGAESSEDSRTYQGDLFRESSLSATGGTDQTVQSELDDIGASVSSDLFMFTQEVLNALPCFTKLSRLFNADQPEAEKFIISMIFEGVLCRKGRKSSNARWEASDRLAEWFNSAVHTAVVKTKSESESESTGTSGGGDMEVDK